MTQRQLVGDAVGNGTASRTHEHLLPGEFIKISADRRAGHAQGGSGLVDLDATPLGQQFHQCGPAVVLGHGQFLVGWQVRFCCVF